LNFGGPSKLGCPLKDRRDLNWGGHSQHGKVFNMEGIKNLGGNHKTWEVLKPGRNKKLGGIKKVGGKKNLGGIKNLGETRTREVLRSEEIQEPWKLQVPGSY